MLIANFPLIIFHYSLLIVKCKVSSQKCPFELLTDDKFPLVIDNFQFSIALLFNPLSVKPFYHAHQ